MAVLGIDIGGTGIKGNLVDPMTGSLVGDRHKIPTPQPSTPDAVVEVIVQMLEHFDYRGPVGCTYPGIVQHGVALSAANVDESWIGRDVDALFTEVTGHPFQVLNDADAAAVAEMRFGAGKGRDGVVIVVTFGTGIGSGMFIDGVLVPNTEFGHLHYQGHAPVEKWCSAKAKVDGDLSWEEWAARVEEYLRHLDRILSPDLVIIGGGISRKWDKYVEFLDPGLEITPAQLENEAGIVGAAMAVAMRT